MKKLILSICSMLMLLLFVNQGFAQVPQGFNYQAVARDASGTLLQNHALAVKLSIHQGSAAGTVVYSERQTPTTNQFGLFTITVGQGTLLSGSFSSTTWSTGNYWMEVGLDVAGGTNYTAMGTTQLLSVPFAMYAASAATATTGLTGPTGATGVTGPTGPAGNLIPGTSGQTLRHDGSGWVANSVIYNNGTKVGIGTTTPSAKLHVQSSGTKGGYFTTDSANYNATAIYGRYTGYSGGRGVAGESRVSPNSGNGVGGEFWGCFVGVGGHGDGGSWSGDAYGGIFDATGTNGTRMAVSAAASGGQTNYGVKSTATGTQTNYGVWGSASGSSTSYGLYCSGSGAYTGTWTLASDAKFKKDITDYSDALKNVMHLRPVTYLMRTEEFPTMNFASGRQYGFIAQELETVFPTLVENGVHPGATKTDKDIEYKGVNYIGLIPVLVSAIQEQQAIIEKQQQQIDELLKLVK